MMGQMGERLPCCALLNSLIAAHLKARRCPGIAGRQGGGTGGAVRQTSPVRINTRAHAVALYRPTKSVSGFGLISIRTQHIELRRFAGWLLSVLQLRD